MSTSRVALDVSRFLDAQEGRVLAGAPREDVRRLAEAFFTAAYEDAGKAPRLLDGDDLAELLTVHLPARLAPRDRAAEHAPAALAALLRHLEESEVVPHAYELRRALDEHVEAFAARVRSGANAARQLAAKQDPYVHRADKIGRNDPCPCGSGKKLKKCHGKGA